MVRINKGWSFFIVLLLCSYMSLAQLAGSVIKAWAFNKPVTHGTLMVDDNGNPVHPAADTSRFIYMECKGNMEPRVDNVMYGSRVFSVAVFPAGQKEILMLTKKDGRAYSIKPAKGNYLWKLELSSSSIQKRYSGNQKKITIKGKLGSKSFTCTLINEIELQPDIVG